jgi:hypothetical protein
MIITLFKTPDHARFLRAFEEAVQTQRQGRVDWNPVDDGQPSPPNTCVGWAAQAPEVSSLLIDANCYDVLKEITRILDVPAITVFFQEKSFWEFALRVRGETKAKFSVAPYQWDEDAPAWEKGSPEVVSTIWSIPAERIAKYLIMWEVVEVWDPQLGMTIDRNTRQGQKSEPGDQYGYGDMYQGLDFIRALGGENPQNGQKFRAHLPPYQRK